ncbi:hypothetical protein ASPZODRAFT_390055 [Penicilliopsis zonata CBS 506.65]|uniref:Uncharacterized protein n=1 Tax=Penicilliopsis zonata CBS 506.65 TaxID=1073090 RepID=A0A1L9SWB2_9EURO|nr:hypothetical protein ASPZODRAFT_390055 [Penicilliopsis zonata CBS 506.65]OJJ51469.1 hypothetical protein ASPZODRAFT_390055 [Penicilliopsis zonata CBS 506.65]
MICDEIDISNPHWRSVDEVCETDRRERRRLKREGTEGGKKTTVKCFLRLPLFFFLFVLLTKQDDKQEREDES